MRIGSTDALGAAQLCLFHTSNIKLQPKYYLFAQAELVGSHFINF